jgi:hypothetical protein
MTDYSFMKSGFNNLVQSDEELMQNVTSLIVCFSENALKTASKYVEHAKRRNISSEDIKRCFMFELFAFSKRPNLKENIENIKRELYSEELDELEDDDVEIGEEEDDFCLSECDCVLCKYINTIYDKWENFQPKSRMEKILKKHIDSI